MDRRRLVEVKQLRQLLRVGTIVLVLRSEDQTQVAGVSHHDPIGDDTELVIQPAVAAGRLVADAERVIELPQPLHHLPGVALDRLPLHQAAGRAEDANRCRSLMNVQAD